MGSIASVQVKKTSRSLPWGWSGVCPIVIGGRSKANLRSIAKLLPRRKSSLAKVVAALQTIRAIFHRGLHQVEFGPTRADRARLLREIIEQLGALRSQLGALPAPLRSQFSALLWETWRSDSPLSIDPLKSYCAQKDAMEAIAMAGSAMHGYLTRAGRAEEVVDVSKLASAAERGLLLVNSLDTTTDSDVILRWRAVDSAAFDDPDDALAVAEEIVRRLRLRLARQLDLLQMMRGPEPGVSLGLLVAHLSDLWTRETGRPVTANPYGKNEYMGRPQSESGRFIRAAVLAFGPTNKWIEAHKDFMKSVRAERMVLGGRHLDHAIHLAIQDFVTSKAVDTIEGSRGRGRPPRSFDAASKRRHRLRQTM